MYFKLIAELKNEFGLSTEEAKQTLDDFMRVNKYNRMTLWKINHIGQKEKWENWKHGLALAMYFIYVDAKEIK